VINDKYMFYFSNPIEWEEKNSAGGVANGP
jgi:hypothetical protein